MEEIMIGVVLWSDAFDRKAVIWCEDQGDLAFFNAREDALQSNAFFDAGDMVQFDMEINASMRRAHNPRLIEECVAYGLPEALRGSAPCDTPTGKTAQIIPFERRVHDVKNIVPRFSEA